MTTLNHLSSKLVARYLQLALLLYMSVVICVCKGPFVPVTSTAASLFQASVQQKFHQYQGTHKSVLDVGIKDCWFLEGITVPLMVQLFVSLCFFFLIGVEKNHFHFLPS